MKINKASNSLSNVAPRKNLIVTIGVTILIAIITLSVYMLLKGALETETYYVLNQNLQPRVKVQADMLIPKEVNKGGAPENAISLAQVENGDVYTKIPLYTGDILTQSNTGVTLDTSTGIPDDWVVTSLNINSSQAAGGQVSRGDYFDLIGITEDEGSKYIATNILALDVNYASKQSEDDKGNVVFNDELQYIIGVPQDKAAIIADATDTDKFKSLRVVMSPRAIAYENRKLDDISKPFKSTMETPVLDLKNGTDPTFATVLRDNNGRPVNSDTCSANLVVPTELCKNVETKEPANEQVEQTETVTPEENKPVETENQTTGEDVEPEETTNSKPVENEQQSQETTNKTKPTETTNNNVKPAQ